jgi:hypothetical protein
MEISMFIRDELGHDSHLLLALSLDDLLLALNGLLLGLEQLKEKLVSLAL